MNVETKSFQAEVSRILDIVTHSLYSEREIFLRELVSNASDACDKLRYLSLTNAELKQSQQNFKISLKADKDKKTLTISDNGIGMSHDELIENLGTIAKSGTSNFMTQLSGDKKKDLDLIGQFGVGFYSAFMVADQVEVISRKAGEEKAHIWSSNGRGTYTISESSKDHAGCDIILHLKEDAHEFLEQSRLSFIIKKYSDYLEIPVEFYGKDEEGKEQQLTLNQTGALWARSKSDIKPEQYKEFYHHISHHFDEPWQTMHWRAEGKIEYTGLLYIPTEKPFDLFQVDRKNKLKLYVRKVFITDDAQELLPGYLRFVQGVVDSQDLPLNVSREMLQHNPYLAKMRSGLVNKILGELKKAAQDEDKEKKANYTKFWGNFGALLKEGLYEDYDHRAQILPLIRFYTTHSADQLISFEEYIKRMKPGQDSIYYLTGESKEDLLKSPHLEGFKAKNIEVILFTDPVDEFWIPSVGAFEEKKFKSITKGGADLEQFDQEASSKDDKSNEEKNQAEKEVEKLIAFMKPILKDSVKDIRSSKRLTSSVSCLVADEGDMDIHLERLLKQHQKIDAMSKRILEINPGHSLIQKMLAQVDQKESGQKLQDMTWLILDQARIQEGEKVLDSQAFSQRMMNMLEQAL